MTATIAEDLATGLKPTHGAAEANKKSVTTYLKQLGLKAPALLETLSEELMHRAKRRVAPDAPNEEVLRLALDEAQRRFDNAIMQTLNLSGKEIQPIAAVRAALLLNDEASDFLFRSEDINDERIAKLQANLPMATPPEAHLEMEEQPISFYLSSSPKARF